MTTRQHAIIEYQTTIVRSAITRPADTTAYASGDIIADTDGEVLRFDKVTRRLSNGRSGAIDCARLTSSANQAAADMELWLFADHVPTLGADNSALALADDDLDHLAGIIPFPADDWRVSNAASGASGNAVCEARNLSLPFVAVNTLHGVLVVRDGEGYTPVSSERFSVALVIYQD